MQTITKRPFGQCDLGAVECVTLDNGNGMVVEVITLGAAIRSITVPDKAGVPTDVVLGYDDPQTYLKCTTFTGGCIGRCANRIGGATFTVEGQTWQVTANQDNTHHLHGGHFGYDKRLWACQLQEDKAVFSLADLHMEEGYPGDATVSVSFSVTEDNQLHITYHGQSDRTTVMNMTHHPYFNFDGHGHGTVDDHLLRIHAPFYTPANDAGIPTGEIRQVAGTPLDLRVSARLGDCIHHPELTQTRGLDHNFVRQDSNNEPFAWVWSQHSGIGMAVSATLPGVQAYTSGFFGDQVGKNGVAYHMHHAVALEPQFFPNAVNYAHFPSPVLKAHTPYHHEISYQFYSNVNW